MIPVLNGDGLLPVGIHLALFAEVEARFGWNSHRVRLIQGLRRAIGALTIAGCRIIYLDGSFVTAEPLPRDYDACWEMAGVQVHDLDPVFLDFNNARAAQKLKFFGEFFPAHLRAESIPPFRRYIDFFQSDKDSGLPKGIVSIPLRGTP